MLRNTWRDDKQVKVMCTGTKINSDRVFREGKEIEPELARYANRQRGCRLMLTLP